jgi:hypothetical protein
MMRPLALPVIVALVVFSPRLSAQVTAAAEANRRTIEFQTSQVTESDVTVSPDGDWLVFSILGHLYRLPGRRWDR